MSDDVVGFLIIFATCIVVGLIWLSIHYYWKGEEKGGRELSPLAKQWMMTSKFAAFFFFAFPFLGIPMILVFDWVFDKIGGLIGIIVLIGAPGALISLIKKGK